MRPVASWTLVRATVVLATAASILPIRANAQLAALGRWDLTTLFASTNDWEQERSLVEHLAVSLRQVRVQQPEGAPALVAMLAPIWNARSRAASVMEFAWLRHIEDITDDSARRRYGLATALLEKVERSSWRADSLVAAIDSATLERWFAVDSTLARRRPDLLATRRSMRRALGGTVGALVAATGSWMTQLGDVRAALLAARTDWPSVLINGTARAVTPDDIGLLRSTADANVRAAAHQALLAKLTSSRESLAQLLVRRVEMARTAALARGFSNVAAAPWYAEGARIDGVEELTDVVRGAGASVRRYLSLKQRAQGLISQRYSDVLYNAPAVGTANTLLAFLSGARAALGGLGPDAASRLDGLYQQPIWDLADRPEKMPNEMTVSGPVGRATPHVFMRYDGGYTSSVNLAGLLAALLAFEGSNVVREPLSRDGPAVFGQAVYDAGRMAYAEYVRKNASDKSERQRLILLELADLHRSVFRRALSIEFESWIGSRIAEGNPPTGAEMSEWYLGLLRTSYGHGRGGVEVDSVFGNEWMLTATLFNSESTSLWAVAYAGGATLLERAQQGDVRAQRAFNGLVGRNASFLSYDLMRDAGVDLHLRAPYDALVKRMNRLLDELESLL